MKKTLKKLRLQKLSINLVFVNMLLVSACYSATTTKTTMPLIAVSQSSINEIQEPKIVEEFGKEAVNPKSYEIEYLNLFQEQFKADPNLIKEYSERIKLNNPRLQNIANLTTQNQIIGRLIKQEIDQKAIDYAHFQYINERTMSLYFTNIGQDGNVSGGYGTGWFFDRLKNIDGSWSNDFIISTNIHVVNQITPRRGRQAENGINGYPKEVLSLRISKLPYNWDTINDKVQYLARNTYQPIGGWNDNKAFGSNNRLRLSQLENVNINNNLNYFLDFSGITKENIKKIWALFHANYKHNEKIMAFATNKAFWEIINNETTKKLNLGNILPRDIDPTFYEEDFFDPNFEANQNLNFNPFVGRHLQIDQVELEKRQAQQSYLDQAFIKLTIDDQTLNNFFPFFANPEKYNEWTFPRILDQEKVSLPYNYQNENFYGNLSENSSRLNEYKLKKNEIYKIWHAGYPVEQPNQNLNYRATGPSFRGGTGDVIEYQIRTKNHNTSNLYLDHTDCKVYSTFCQNDYVQPGGFTIGATGSNTGGGSSGSLALDRDYNAVGIYWGSTRLGQGVEYISKGLYNPFQISSDTNKINIFEPFTNASRRFKFEKTGLANALLRDYLQNLFRDYYHKNINWNQYAANRRYYNNIDFTSEETIANDIAEVFNARAKQNPSQIIKRLINPHNYSEGERSLLLLRALKKQTTRLVNNQIHVDNRINHLLDFLVRSFENSPTTTYYQITPFYQRKLGEVNIKKQLGQYLNNHSLKSYIYNK